MRFTQAQVKYWLSKLRYFFFEQKKGDTKKIQEEIVSSYGTRLERVCVCVIFRVF